MGSSTVQPRLTRDLAGWQDMGNNDRRPALRKSTMRLLGLFFFSGFSALIYQVAWQRKLFTLFGTNTESVTVIVAVFMLGLGFGAMLGWRLSRLNVKLPVIFMILELIIGIYGLVSLSLVDWIGNFYVGADRSALVLVGISGSIFLIPTLCMGATLPILVRHLNLEYRQVVRSLSWLYAANTLGSALAAFVTVALLFGWLGLSRTVLVAVLLNFMVGAGVWLWFKDTPAPAAAVRVSKTRAVLGYRPLLLALVLSFFSGYFVLSMEILWFRYLNFSAASAAPVFGYMLFAFLGGLGVGALRAERKILGGLGVGALRAERKNWRTGLELVGCWLLFTSSVFYFSFPLLSEIMAGHGKHVDVLDWRLLAVAITAFFAGGIFPSLASALGAGNADQVGSDVAILYGASIAGAFLGPYITAFMLFEIFSLEENIALLSGFGALAGILILVSLRTWPGVGVLIAGAALLFGLGYFKPLYARLLWKAQSYYLDGQFIKVVQNRHGIITVDASGIVMGGGAYDGTLNIDPRVNSNYIHRAYLIAALHSAPQQVLQVGLSTGSWAWVLSHYSSVRQLDIVEINPGYLEIGELFEPSREVLNDSKISIHIDDGRRWLSHDKDRRYDLIVMNTSYHWRAYLTFLLSREFFEHFKSHLIPGGVVYLNTTGSEDVVATGLSVFRYAIMIDNFVALSDSEFKIGSEQLRKNLLNFRDSAGGVYFSGERSDVLDWLVRYFELKVAQVGVPPGSGVITDDNMRTEF